MCYLQGGASYRTEPLSFGPQDLDPFACTHVIYAFATLDPHDFNIIPRDEEYDIVQGTFLHAIEQLSDKLLNFRRISIGNRLEAQKS